MNGENDVFHFSSEFWSFLHGARDSGLAQAARYAALVFCLAGAFLTNPDFLTIECSDGVLPNIPLLRMWWGLQQVMFEQFRGDPLPILLPTEAFEIKAPNYYPAKRGSGGIDYRLSSGKSMFYGI